jgi:hypothetical protein|tara:strand:- start:287 stop:994 length:708 start_codon:yes stop_codon:yes gene_type:complete
LTKDLLKDILADFALQAPSTGNKFHKLQAPSTNEKRESEDVTRGWVFKEATDIAFLDAYPEVVKLQNVRWEIFAAYFEARQAQFMHPPCPPHVSTSVATQARKLVLSTILRKGIVKMSAVRSCLYHSNSHQLHSLALLNEPELLGTLGDNVVCIDGVCALLSLGDVVIDPLRKILLNLFKVKGRIIKRVDIIKKAKAELEVMPSNPAFMRCVKDVCFSRGNSWILRDGIEHHMPA